jgi:fumarate reductase flavoprotein subunit/NADH-quinone oxidoreductase subunit F
MNAIENAKALGREAVIEQISRVELWKEHPSKLVAALDNSDTSGVLLNVLKKDAKKVFDGMEIAAFALGAPEKILHVPEYAKELASDLRDTANEYGVTIVLGPVDKRSYTDASIHHLITMITFADYFAGNTDRFVYVSVNNGELEKYVPETRIHQIADTTNAKAMEIGYRLHPVTDADLTLADSGVTNGVVNILTGNNCIVHEMEERLLRSLTNCCGKCVFCREGLIQLEAMHKDITAGKGKAEHLLLIKEICEVMAFSSYCSLGQKSAEAVLSAVEYFTDEYETHIKKKNCPAGVCTAFIRMYIDPETCSGCTECMDVCPVDCIDGRNGYVHIIDEVDCTRCGKCISACPENAIVRAT